MSLSYASAQKPSHEDFFKHSAAHNNVNIVFIRRCPPPPPTTRSSNHNHHHHQRQAYAAACAQLVVVVVLGGVMLDLRMAVGRWSPAPCCTRYLVAGTSCACFSHDVPWYLVSRPFNKTKLREVRKVFVHEQRKMEMLLEGFQRPGPFRNRCYLRRSRRKKAMPVSYDTSIREADRYNLSKV